MAKDLSCVQVYLVISSRFVPFSFISEFLPIFNWKEEVINPQTSPLNLFNLDIHTWENTFLKCNPQKHCE